MVSVAIVFSPATAHSLGNWWFRTGAKCWAMDRRWSMPVQSQATQQEVRGRQVIKSSSVFAAAPHCSHYHLTPPWQINVVLDFQRSMNPTMNCTCEESRLLGPYENLMPADLRWSWDGDVSTRTFCKYRLSLAKRFDCTETIMNQLLVYSS